MRSRYLMLLIGLTIVALIAGRALRSRSDQPVSHPPEKTAAPTEPPQTASPGATPKTSVAITSALEAPKETLVPRDPGEWQGMLVDLAMLQTECDRSSQCGLAMACKKGRCAPCDRDDDCGHGEICAVQHCVLSANAECSSRKDCREPGSYCVLTGYTPNVRGNEDMHSKCMPNSGGLARGTAPVYVPNSIPQGEPTQGKSLLDAL
jgi:hypothetical protein